MLDGGGLFILLNGRSDLPKIEAGNRVSGTREENKAIVQGSIALFGTYTVDSATKRARFQHRRQHLSNQVQRRPSNVAGDN